MDLLGLGKTNRKTHGKGIQKNQKKIRNILREFEEQPTTGLALNFAEKDPQTREKELKLVRDQVAKHTKEKKSRLAIKWSKINQPKNVALQSIQETQKQLENF